MHGRHRTVTSNLAESRMECHDGMERAMAQRVYETRDGIHELRHAAERTPVSPHIEAKAVRDAGSTRLDR